MKKLSSAEIKYWRPIVILVLAILWMIIFPLWRDWVTARPLDVPISFSQRIEIHKEVTIRAEENYALSLVFERKEVPFETMKLLIGNSTFCIPNTSPCSKGVPVFIHWNFVDRDTNIIVASDDSQTQDSSGWSTTEVDRFIAQVKLPRGRYIFNATTEGTIPELVELQTRMIMRVGMKDIRSFTYGLAWVWGQIIWSLLAPLSIILSISVLIRREYRKRLDAEQPKH